MTDKDTISVIMACYNCERTLPKAIDSILAQTYENWVIICCDDGSSDGTLSVLRSYAEKYPEKFVILVNDTNRKLPYSLNRCLSAVETELVARMDGDDWCLPERFEKQLRFLREHPEYDLVGTGVGVSDGEKIVASIVKRPVPTKESMLHQNAFSHATIMTYKRVYDALGGYSLDPTVERVEDVDLWCRFLAAGFRGYNLTDQLYVILEDEQAARRRTFRARLNSAHTRAHGYRLMGFRGFRCIQPYFIVLRAFIPQPVYRVLHMWQLKNGQEKNND